MRVEKISGYSMNKNFNVQKNVNFQAEGDIIKIQNILFKDCGDGDFTSKLPLNRIAKSSIKLLKDENEKNWELLKSFTPKNIKEYLLELIRYAKGEKSLFCILEYGNHLNLEKVRVNEPVKEGLVNRGMEEYLKEERPAFVISDEKGQDWIVSTRIGYSNAHETKVGPVGLDVAPMRRFEDIKLNDMYM